MSNLSPLFTNAEFFRTAFSEKDFPTLGDQKGNLFPEVAVVGRSNVGKSSLLNDLFQRKNLVKVSQEPGKTIAINFFLVSKQFFLVDLPGYGFAKVPKKLRQDWGVFVHNYLSKRSNLKLILFLFDIRRNPVDDDQTFMNWLNASNLPAVIIFTKVDKVSSQEKKRNTEQFFHHIKSDFSYPFLYYSVKDHVGREELMKQIVFHLSQKEKRHAS